MKRFAERLFRLSAWKFALVAAVLIAALAGAHAPAQPSSGSEAQQDAMLNCPQPGRWAISVWSGQDDADAEQAFATCGEGAMAAAYYIDPDTQMWSRWFKERPAVSNLATLDRLQGVLALGGANAPAAPPSGSPAQPHFMDNCPQLGKWAIAVWEGPDGTGTEWGLAHCLAPVVEAAYYIDPQTQDWLRWFKGRPEVSNLATLNHLQGVIAMVPAATTAPLPPPEEVGDISAGGKAVVNYGNSTWYTGTIEFQGPTSQAISINCCTSPAPDILAPPELCKCADWVSFGKAITLPPGTYSVTVRFDDPYWGTHFAGEWTLEADKEYALCFCLGPAATWEDSNSHRLGEQYSSMAQLGHVSVISTRRPTSCPSSAPATPSWRSWPPWTWTASPPCRPSPSSTSCERRRGGSRGKPRRALTSVMDGVQ